MREQASHTAKSNAVSKVVGAVLILGGLLGIASSIPMVLHFAHQDQIAQMISTLVIAALFVWGIPTGIGVWRESPRELKWARVIFALQIPVFSIGRLVYQYSNLFSIRLMVGNTTHNLGADIGSSGNLDLLPHSPGFMFGINLFAVIVLAYLVGRSQRRVPGKARHI
jgi:hypothetical protein